MIGILQIKGDKANLRKFGDFNATIYKVYNILWVILWVMIY